jgi:GT2 family glycosyltransferase
MTPESMAVDVIILSLNRVEDTIAAIESALEQEGVPVSTYVVDQGSAPDQLERLRRFVSGKPVVLHELGRNIGVPGGRNVASRLGQAPVIIALDNDAVFASSTTAKCAAERLVVEPQLGAIGFRILNYFTGKDDVSSWGYPRALLPRSEEEFPAAMFVGAGHAIRRTAFEAAGGYDDSLFFAWEELDLSYRILNRGYLIRYVPAVAVRHKVSPEGRVRWSNGRFYYTVRNRLYLHAKYGASRWRIVRSACGFAVKGARNGALTQTFRAIKDAIGMYRNFRATNKETALCQLSENVRSYIRHCHLEDTEGLMHQRLRQVLRRFTESY